MKAYRRGGGGLTGVTLLGDGLLLLKLTSAPTDLVNSATTAFENKLLPQSDRIRLKTCVVDPRGALANECSVKS